MDEEFQRLTDEELVNMYSNYGDPDAKKAIELEQNRRHHLKIENKARTANNVAIGSLVVAIISMLIAVVALVKS
ncbi:hypothetical protein CWB99_22925 [Pseudoalteromonas rubra]|uniref:Uncharacterized protein n=1 Tax=Pseudoalteromonas rubra TaxID=43658 RepID=A0A5S3WF02_9GAMM|nr:hypothetical protein [Pseudoalteromonas rubra]TMP23952.1 hypothetical protein CWB99_22925 [Pseudoalteromonas rubra]TMP27849.1 hypothetical protein CWC00_22600 [Pseudoalteromonas rubra]